MEKQNRIQISPGCEELAIATGWFIIEVAKSAVEARGRFVISLAGGHTPEQVYVLLSKPPFRDHMPWNKTYIFWGDERCVAPDNKDNNAHMARVKLLNHITLPSHHIYPIPVNLQPTEAASKYENTIKSF